MKKTLTALLAYLILAPIAADLFLDMLGEFARTAILFLGLGLWIGSGAMACMLIINYFVAVEDKVFPDNLDEKIFGGGDD